MALSWEGSYFKRGQFVITLINAESKVQPRVSPVHYFVIPELQHNQ